MAALFILFFFRRMACVLIFSYVFVDRPHWLILFFHPIPSTSSGCLNLTFDPKISTWLISTVFWQFVIACRANAVKQLHLLIYSPNRVIYNVSPVLLLHISRPFRVYRKKYDNNTISALSPTLRNVSLCIKWNGLNFTTWKFFHQRQSRFKGRTHTFR